MGEAPGLRPSRSGPRSAAIRECRPTDRVVAWFSAGATSAVAAMEAVRKYGHDNLVVAYCDTGSEHESNAKFLKDVEAWIEHPITILKSKKYSDIWDVFELTGWLVGPAGARCTGELKRAVRQQFEDFDDIQVFGYDPAEVNRVEKFKTSNPEVKIWCPLIEKGLTKAHCLQILRNAGIELPAMYQPQKSGGAYDHNNCIGCVKGQSGYWNKIRVDFPEVFDRMAKLERKIGAAICKTEPTVDGLRQRIPVYLDELAPDAGNFDAEPGLSCDMFCHVEAGDYSQKGDA
jgi:hypothetical protein